MIELPEARTISKDLRKEILSKTIIDVSGNFTDHKFTFYHDDPNKYKEQLVGKKVTNIIDRNYYIEIEIQAYLLTFRDGANIRYYSNELDVPNKSKLLIKFDDNSFLNVTTSMYCFIGVFKKDSKIDNTYYNIELNGIGPMDQRFTFEYFKSLLNKNTLKISTKGFLATEQRILGIGNGVVQDILFNSELNPKRKMNTLNDKELLNLYNSVIVTLTRMINQNGRNTETDVYGNSGGYKTILSNKTYKGECYVCGSEIKKEQYLGGSIYYCPNCQK